MSHSDIDIPIQIRRVQEYTVRVQAQGGGLEQSRVVHLKRPVQASEAVAALRALKSSLSRSELRQRDEAFQRAERWIRQVEACGGTVPMKRTFQNRQLRGTDIRVDVEVIRGPINLVP